MEIAIFENEFGLLEYSFDLVNKLYYNNELKFSVFPKSQDLEKPDTIVIYSIIFVDLDLSPSSELDGYALISELIKIRKKLPIVIITGASNVQEKLKQKKLPDFPILLKPIDFKKLFKTFEKFIEPKSTLK